MSVITANPDKYGILGPVNRRIKTGSTLNQAAQEQYSNQTVDVQLQALLKPAVTVKSFEPLPEDIFTKKLNVNTSNLFFRSHFVNFLSLKLKNLSKQLPL